MGGTVHTLGSVVKDSHGRNGTHTGVGGEGLTWEERTPNSFPYQFQGFVGALNSSRFHWTLIPPSLRKCALDF